MRSLALGNSVALALAIFAVSPVAAQVRYQFTSAQLDAGVLADSGPQAIWLVDVDKVDGPDIVVVDHDSASVNLYLNDGTGTFSTEPDDTSDTDDGPVAVASGDFDGNGRIDLVTVNDTALSASILLGTGDCAGNGCFDDTAIEPIQVGATPVGVVVADFDRDGRQDLAVLSPGSVYLLRGNGDGTFTPFATPVVPTLGVGGAAIVAGDFDGDGKTDLAASNGQNSSVSVLLGNGDGTFKRAVLYFISPGARGVVARDLNGDGKLDLAVAESDQSLIDQNVAILLGQSGGTFMATNPPAEGSMEGVTSVTAADLDGDGRPELVVTNNTDPFLAVLENCGPDIDPGLCPPNVNVIVGEFFQLQGTISGLGLGDGQVAIQVGDLNQDGKIDLVALGAGGDNIGVFLNFTNGTLPTPVPQTVTATPQFSFTPTPVAPTKTFTLTPTPTPTPIPSAPYGVCNSMDSVGDLGGRPVAVTVGSFTNPRSSSPSIAVALDSNKVIFLQTNIQAAPTPMGTTDSCAILGLGLDAVKTEQVTSPTALAAADFDHDGNLDLAVVGAGGLSVFYGKDDGTFPAATAYTMSIPGSPHSIAVADLNRDGFPDVIVGNEAAGDVAIFINAEGQSFQTPCMVSVGQTASLVVSQDLNRDGRQDFAVGSDATNLISVFLQRGPTPTSTPGTAADSTLCQALASTFGGRAPLPAVPPTLKGLVVDNFDPSDSIPDFAVVTAPPSHTTDGSVVVFLGSAATSGDVTYAQRGNPLTVRRPTPSGSPTPSQPSALASADINLDGRNDLIITDRANDDIVIFLGAANGSFSTSLIPFPVGGVAPVGLAVADIDGDGKPDIVTANMGDTGKPGSVSILISSNPPPPPTPSPTVPMSPSATPTSTPTLTPSVTGTPTVTSTPSVTPTHTRVPSLTASPVGTATAKPGTFTLSSCAVDPGRRFMDNGSLLLALVGLAAFKAKRRLGYGQDQ